MATFLVELAGVVRPLVHRHWISMVTRLNKLPESRLEEFLFGRDRVSLTPVCQSSAGVSAWIRDFS